MPSFEQRTDGNWSVRFRTFDGLREVNKRLSGFKTKRAARQAYEEYAVLHPTEKICMSDTPESSFRDLVREFLLSKKDEVEETSYIDMEGRISKHILPAFGNKRPADITVADIEKWQESLTQLGLAYRTKNNIRNYLQQIYKLAKRRYGIPNVMDEVSPFRKLVEREDMRVWSEKEFAAFLAKADEEGDPVYRAFFHTLYITGMRRGEALALTREDVVLSDPPYIRINKNLTYKTKGATYKIKAPKTKESNRNVLIPAALAQELLSLPDNTFLFGKNGKPLSENTISRKFKRIASKAGIPEIRIHDLRHSHASFLISHNVPVTAISKRLGHSTIEQTLNTYAHMLPSDEEKIASAISLLS